MREHKLKSGHIELSFERGKEELRVHRLSMAQMLLRGTDLTEWYGRFFKKQLRDFKYESSPAAMGTMDGIAVEGRPRSRWRQILRPLPLINPRPRRYLEGRIWHSTTTNKICAVEHLFAKKGTGDGLAQRVADGYFELEEGSQAEPRGDAGLAADPQ